jgi:tetratricopeptide (TPR) repeat protein
MKKILIGLIAVVFIAGCGARASQEKRNYVQEGMKYLSQKDLGNAVKSFDLAIQKDPENVDTCLAVAEIYLMLKNYAAVETLCARALKLDPNRADAYYFLALTQAMQSKTTTAIEFAKRSVYLFTQQQNEKKAQAAAILLKKLVGPNNSSEGAVN